jgi:hypothetical protein
MKTLTSLRRTLFLAVALLLVLQANAGAVRLHISNTGIRATYSQLRIADSLGGEIEARCPVTLEGTFHESAITKTADALLGYITRAIVNRAACTFHGGITDVTILNGTERLLTGDIPTTSLPWHMRYERFFGTLPRITQIDIKVIRLAVLALFLGGSCLYRSSTEAPARFGIARNLTTGQVTTIFPDAVTRIPRAGGGIFCAEAIIMEGESAVRLLSSTTQLIFIELI